MFAAIVAAVGLTASGKLIEAERFLNDADRRVLLVAGLDGDGAAVKLLRGEKPPGKRFQLTTIALANPDRAALKFPPPGAAYREHPESHALWRWILAEAPDLVVIAGADPGGLAAALADHVPAVQVPLRKGMVGRIRPPAEHSPLRLEMQRRLARSPRQVAEELARVYGHELPEPVYIPALALIGRLRLGYREDVERIVEPYRSGGKDPLAKPTASHFSGHLVFADLFARTQNPRYRELVSAAAARALVTPRLDNEMSDWFFMACPILAAAGRPDDALAEMRRMRAKCLRGDGLMRHSPLDEAAWGRGNAFPLLGLALTLQAMPREHAGFEPMLRDFQNHAAALASHQDGEGMWREVIDKPGAYREFSATAMIGRAMLIGVRQGWLEEKSYRPRIDQAWQAINARTGRDGVLLDVCESTGKQKSLADYLHRKAIFDRDPRGGAMALMFATEMAGLQ